VAEGSRQGGLRRIATIAPSPELLLATWLVLSPWISWVVRFPADRSILTFDRVAVLLVAIAFAAHAVSRRRPIGLAGGFEIGWAGYAIVGFASALAVAADAGAALRIVSDALVLPLLLYASVRRGLDVARGARPLFWSLVALGLALPLPGILEIWTGVDYFAFKGGSLLRDGVVRPNGPFENDVAYAVVASIVAVAIASLPRALDVEPRGGARWLLRTAFAGALLAAMLPMFRTIAIALVAAFAVPLLVEMRFRSLARVAVVALLVAIAAGPLVASIAANRTFENRVTDPSSVYSRLATLRSGLEIVAEHPLAGVGLGSYHAYYVARYGDGAREDDVEIAGVGAESSPHNNLLGVLAELGVVGLFFYLLAAVSLVALAWRERNLFALSLIAVYAVPGLTLQHGIYGPVNLYAFFAFALALQSGARVREASSKRKVEAAEEEHEELLEEAHA
jgi:O-antigen ligase